MNFLLIFVAITGIFDYLQEDDKNIMKQFKFALCFVTLIPVFYSLYLNILSPKTILLVAIRSTLDSAFPGFLNQCENYIYDDHEDNIRGSLGLKRKKLYHLFNTCSEDGKPDKRKITGRGIYMYHDFINDIKSVNLNNFDKLYVVENEEKREYYKNIINNDNIPDDFKCYMPKGLMCYIHIKTGDFEYSRTLLYNNIIRAIRIDDDHYLFIHPLTCGVIYFYKAFIPKDLPEPDPMYIRDDLYAFNKDDFYNKSYIFDKHIHKLSEIDFLKFNIAKWHAKPIHIINKSINGNDILNNSLWKFPLLSRHDETLISDILDDCVEDCFNENYFTIYKSILEISKENIFITYEVPWENESEIEWFDHKLRSKAINIFIKINDIDDKIKKKADNFNDENNSSLSTYKIKDFICRVLEKELNIREEIKEIIKDPTELIEKLSIFKV